MRLLQPDDTRTMNLFLIMPNVIVHRIDAYSPFLPPNFTGLNNNYHYFDPATDAMKPDFDNMLNEKLG